MVGSDCLCEALLESSLPDAGEDAINEDLLIDGIILEQIEFEVLTVAASPTTY